jgi:hypothetical protein
VLFAETIVRYICIQVVELTASAKLPNTSSTVDSELYACMPTFVAHDRYINIGKLVQALDSLAFDAKLNVVSWRHSVERSGLPTQIKRILVTPSTDLGTSFHEYCARFCPSPKVYETSSIYSGAQWNVGDVLHHIDGVMLRLCSVSDHYRTEEFSPYDIKAGALDHLGAQEDAVFDKAGRKLTRFASIPDVPLSVRV